MLQLLVLAIVLSACVADEEGQATATPQYLIHNDYQRLENHRLRQDLERLRHELKISKNPHSHLDDPYRREHDASKSDDNRREGYDNRREGHDNRREGHDHHREGPDNHREGHDNRREGHDNRREGHDHHREGPDNHREGHDNRREGHDNRRKGHDNLRDDNDRRTKHENKWWTDKDRIEHKDDEHDIEGPVILRSITTHDDHHKPDIARQNKIIKDVYSPDYAQPTWIIDYRYLKTGGRDYTRGPGGQILILPKGIRTNEHKEFQNYDELIDHLRELRLAERAKPQYFMPLGQEINNHKVKLEHKQDDDGWYN